MKVLALILVGLFTSTIASAKDKALGVDQGSKAPTFSATAIDKSTFALDKNLPALLVFYRGGWCPYCNTQLRKLKRDVYPSAKAAKVEVVAISVDKIDEGSKTQKSEDLPFTVISDPKMNVIEKWNLKYKVPEDLVKKYKTEYKIDLEKSSGEKHHTIAVPGVFLVGKDGMVRYSYVNEDYKVRAPTKDIVKAIKALKTSKTKKTGH